jgi:hypothetical protein
VDPDITDRDSVERSARDVVKTRTSLTERDAMAFVTPGIADEAFRAGRPLSETERRMLYFSEGGPHPEKLGALVEAFEQECDEQEYERRIVALTRAARKRADRTKAVTWSAALERLKTTDDYLCAILVGADVFPSPSLSWRGIVVVLALFASAFLLPFALDAYLGHEATRDEVGFHGWLAAMTAAIVYTAGRWLCGAKRVDELIGRVLDTMFRPGRR